MDTVQFHGKQSCNILPSIHNQGSVSQSHTQGLRALNSPTELTRRKREVRQARKALQRFARESMKLTSMTLPDHGPHWDDSYNDVPSCETPQHVAMFASTRLYRSQDEKLQAKAARTALHAQRVQAKLLRRQWALENGAQLSPWWQGLMSKPSSLAGILAYRLQVTEPAFSDFKLGDAVEVMPTYLEYEDLVGRRGVIEGISDNIFNARYGLPLDTADVAFGDCGCCIPMVHLRHLPNAEPSHPSSSDALQTPVVWKKRVGHRTRYKQRKKQNRGSVHGYASQ